MFERTVLLLKDVEHLPAQLRRRLGTFVLQREVAAGLLVEVALCAEFALGFGQELVRETIWAFWQTSSASQFMKKLIYFVFMFSFATLRLWITLTILTLGLKQSYIRDDAG